jgi:hypothetical protein
MTEYPLDGLARTSVPPAGAREIAPGVLRLAVAAARKTPDGLAGLGDILVQVGEASVLSNDVIVGQDDPGTEPGSDPIEDDVFADKPAPLAWLGKLICLMTATSTSTTIVWALVG